MFKKMIKKIYGIAASVPSDETQLMAIGTLLTNQQLLISSTNICDYEFKIFSQSGEDGIIQHLIRNITIENDVFIEFGVEDYLESNTRFLMMKNNWSGFVMDGSQKNMDGLKNNSWYWKHSLNEKAAFITLENINELLHEREYANVGLISIDIDGNDYFILETIDLSKLNPAIIIIEYNSLFEKDRAISVPYRKDFDRTNAHYSNLYFGASLAAINFAAEKKGYSLVGSNLIGSNAFFVRSDLLNDKIKKVDVKSAFKESRFRQSRNKNNSLSFLSREEGIRSIKGLDVINVLNRNIEKL